MPKNNIKSFLSQVPLPNAIAAKYQEPSEPRDDEQPTTSKDALESSSSVPSASAAYACICCEHKCPLEKDFLESQSDKEGDPPFLVNSPSMARDSKDTVTVQIAAPRCNCANCPLRNLCKWWQGVGPYRNALAMLIVTWFSFINCQPTRNLSTAGALNIPVPPCRACRAAVAKTSYRKCLPFARTCRAISTTTLIS